MSARRSPARIARVAADVAHESLVRALSTLWFRLLAPWRNVRCGKQIEVYGRVIVRSPRGRIVVGDRAQLLSSPWRTSATGISSPVRLRTFFDSAEIIFGEGAGMNGGSVTARSKTIRIGRNTMIGPDCAILDSDFHVAWPPEARADMSGDELDAPVTIGDNVWLGARCLVLKGVDIGENCVIAAGSVVVNSIPPNSLAGGNPARVLKTYA